MSEKLTPVECALLRRFIASGGFKRNDELSKSLVILVKQLAQTRAWFCPDSKLIADNPQKPNDRLLVYGWMLTDAGRKALEGGE